MLLDSFRRSPTFSVFFTRSAPARSQNEKLKKIKQTLFTAVNYDEKSVDKKRKFEKEKIKG